VTTFRRTSASARRAEPIRRAPHRVPSPVQHVRVNHRRRHMPMPQQLLIRADVVPVLEQVGGERVPQRMAGDTLRQARLPGRLFHRTLNHRFVKMVPPPAAVARAVQVSPPRGGHELPGPSVDTLGALRANASGSRTAPPPVRSRRCSRRARSSCRSSSALAGVGPDAAFTGSARRVPRHPHRPTSSASRREPPSSHPTTIFLSPTAVFRPDEVVFRPDEVAFRPHESMFRFDEVVFGPHESIFRPHEAIFRPHEAIFTHDSAIFSPETVTNVENLSLDER
jgi:hypothetical protein